MNQKFHLRLILAQPFQCTSLAGEILPGRRKKGNEQSPILIYSV